MNAMTEHANIDEALKSINADLGVNANVLQVSAALCAMRVISEGVAQVPLRVLTPDDKGGKKKAQDHPLYGLLAHAPNSWQTSFEFREMLTNHAVVGGNGYAYINRVKGKIKELIPYDIGQVAPRQIDRFELEYDVSEGGKRVTRPAHDILHLRGPGFNSCKAIDIARAAQVVLRLSDQLQKGQTRTHERNRKPDSILSYKGGTLTPEALKKVADAWDAKFGPNGDGGVAVLEDLWEFIAMSQSAVDSQTLESRQFQINEVARIFRVFPQMLMETAKSSTYASAEQFFMAHVNHTLMPWVVRWEQVIKRDLIGIHEPEYAKHNMNALMRGTMKDRNEYYRGGIEAGWMMRSEPRELEDLNPIPGLEEPILPMNMGLVSTLWKRIKPKKDQT